MQTYTLETIYICADNVSPDATTPSVTINFDPGYNQKFEVRTNGRNAERFWTLADAYANVQSRVAALKAEHDKRLADMLASQLPPRPEMTQEIAEHLASQTKGYRARKMRGQWVVWCDESDHVVEF